MANNIHPSKVPVNKRLGQRAKMSQADRAKQFMPFDALTGLSDLLYDMVKQKEYVRPKVLADDQLALINERLSQLEPGMMVAVDYIWEGEARHVEGCVAKVFAQAQILQVVTTLIEFSAIYELEIL